MPAQVFHATMRSDLRRNLLDKVDLLLRRLELPTRLTAGQIVAIKVHFGEHGNTAFVRPVFVRQVVQAVAKTGARPFVTDTNTLYRGTRSDAVVHLETATHHGFTAATLGAPVVIADGLRARAGERVPVAGVHHRELPIADAIARADALVTVNHFKLHEATGFGGAIKNLGMGSAPREGKLLMHSSVSPYVEQSKCVGDAICVRACTFDAITLVKRKAQIDEAKCTGCAECLGVCPEGAIHVKWNQGLERLGETMAEFALAAVHGKEGRCLHLSFVTQVSPACDCYGMNDVPVVADQGIFASLDPVALDQACLDAVQRAPGQPDSALKTALAPGADKIADIYPSVPYLAQLIHAERIGLGERAYELHNLG